MNDFTFSPLTLSEAHRRRRANRPAPFFVDFAVPEAVDPTKNEQEPEVVA